MKAKVPIMDLYVHTIQIGRLLISVRGSTTTSTGYDHALERIAEPRHMEVSDFPPVEAFRWPPHTVMSNAEVIEYGGADNTGQLAA